MEVPSPIYGLPRTRVNSRDYNHYDEHKKHHKKEEEDEEVHGEIDIHPDAAIQALEARKYQKPIPLDGLDIEA